ncbi:MAG: hypothetical protein M0Z63_00450 [Actinomycetota bacterium]|nr:hypothetical protein [Actinomycetota bacterium]MDA8278897.1 hypothetical protein [Actinomycetota bacterium]
MPSTDRALTALEWLARRRRRAGEPVWLLVMAAVWLVRRAAVRPGELLWRGTVRAGETVRVSVHQTPTPPDPAG